MIIGTFEYDAKENTYSGDIQTLTFSRSAMLVPVEKRAEREPDYRIVDIASTAEFGAAWKRTSERGREFLSVSLDDPSLGGPLNAALFPDEDDAAKASLVWSRLKAKSAEADAPKAKAKAKKAA